jgi:hypothetical protein
MRPMDGAGNSRRALARCCDGCRVRVSEESLPLLVQQHPQRVAAERRAVRQEQQIDLIRKLWELKTVQDVKVGPSQFPRLDLVEPGKEGGVGPGGG